MRVDTAMALREAAGRLPFEPAAVPHDRVEERLDDLVLEFVRRELGFLLRVAEEAISTSTAGMLAATSTRNGACWMGAGSSRRARRSSSSTKPANDADSARCRACAISHRISSMSREPPPNTGTRQASGALGHPARLVAEPVEAQVEHLGAPRSGAATRWRAG